MSSEQPWRFINMFRVHHSLQRLIGLTTWLGYGAIPANIIMNETEGERHTEKRLSVGKGELA